MSAVRVRSVCVHDAMDSGDDLPTRARHVDRGVSGLRFRQRGSTGVSSPARIRMMRSSVVMLSLAVALGAACGGDANQNAQRATTPAPAAAPLPHGSVREDLTFTGDISG